MFQKTFLTLVGSALALTLLSVQPAMAQSAAARAGGQDEENATEGQRRGRNARPQRRAPAPTPEQNKTAAQALLTGAGVGCPVSEAMLLGVTTEGHSTYEVTCASGPGYLVVGSTPPQTFNCVELAGQAETNRLRDPAADVGQQCAIPANVDPLPLLSSYAREAGIDCTVDRASAIGKSSAGELIYEIGCADRDGYWLEKAGDSWKALPCWDISLGQATCRYSTAEESLGAWKTILGGTDAASCEVQQARRAGRDAEGLTVYEVKCGAGDGYFARVDATYKAVRVHPCATAQNIGGGCTLTPAPAAAASEQ